MKKRNVSRLVIFLSIGFLGIISISSLKWLNTNDEIPVSYVITEEIDLRDAEAKEILGKNYDPLKSWKGVYKIKVNWKRGTFPFLKEELDTLTLDYTEKKNIRW